MYLKNWKESDLKFLRKFYEDGCSVKWDEIENRTTTLGRSISNWIENSAEPQKYPLILPSILPDGKSNWIAMTFTPSQREELREFLNAYIGPSGSDYNGLIHVPDEGESLSRIVSAWTKGCGYYQFHCHKDQKEAVKNRLVTLQNVLKRRPSGRKCAERITESILTDFQRALVSKNENLAGGFIDELREGGRLSSENLLFLKFELYATFDQWSEMQFDPLWSRLLLARRPRRVTSHMIKSIWYTQLAKYAESKDPDKLIDVMRSSILPSNSTLFRSYPGFQSPESKLTCIAAYVAMSPQRGVKAQEIAESLPALSEARVMADSLLKHLVNASPSELPSISVDDPLLKVTEALKNDDFDLAWTMLQELPSGVEVCKLLFACSLEMNLAQVSDYISSVFLALSESDQDEMLKTQGRQKCWLDIKEARDRDKAPSDWESWLNALDDHPDSKLVNEWSRDAIETWDLQMYRDDVNRVRKLASSLEASLDGPRGQFLQFALPDLIKFFQPDGEAEVLFKPIYSRVLLFFGLSEAMGPSDWSIAESLLASLLSVGLSEEEYKDCIEAVSEIWGDSGDLKHLGWALDILDLLITSPVKNEEVFEFFFAGVLQTFHKFARRVSADDKIFFELLCDDLGRHSVYEGIPFPQDESETEETELSLNDLFSGRDIGILTLQEGPALRVKALLEKLCDKVRIRISHAYGGCDKLKSIALECDYAVVVTQACKHQAYYFLRDNRPASRNELVLPAGRGANSIISALKEQALKSMS